MIRSLCVQRRSAVRWMALTVTLLLGCMACATTAENARQNGVVDKVAAYKGQVDWTQGEVKATGVGLAPKRARGAEARTLAREAAIVVAQRNLTGIVYGIRITSDTTVKDAVVESDEIRRRVEGVIRGAVVTAEKSLKDGSYEVTMVMRMYGRTDSLADSIDFQKPAEVKEPDSPEPRETSEPPVVIATPKEEQPEAPAPGPGVAEKPAETPVVAASQPEVTPPPVQQGPFTGLLVDCRGIKITRAMGPRIYDVDGADVWGLIKMDYDLAIEKGKLGYYKTVAQAKSMRVGANPLIVKAVGSRGNKFYPADAIVSVADGALVLSENAKYHFLEKLSVGFLVD